MMVKNGFRPLVLRMHDLDKDNVRKSLLDELKPDTGCWLELPCDNGTRTFDRVKAAVKKQKISLVIDQAAQKNLQGTAAKSNYLLFVEDVTPEDATRLLQHIGLADKQAAANKPGEARVDRLVLLPMAKARYDVLGHQLGIDPGKLESPAKQSADQASTGARPTVLVIPYGKGSTAKNSAEVKRFLDNRKPVRPGTIRLVIVLQSI